MRARYVFVPFLVALWGCEAPEPELTPEEKLARVAANLVSTSCERNPDDIASAGLVVCDTDEMCATDIPGTYCNRVPRRCAADCVSDNDCSTNQVCDCSGRCVATDALPPAEEAPTVSLNPSVIDSAAGSAPKLVALEVITQDDAFAPNQMPRPPLDLHVHVARTPGTPAEVVDAIQVACTDNLTGAVFGASCSLTSWTFSTAANGKFQATRHVYVRRNPAAPVSTDTDVTWDIAVLSNNLEDEHQRMSVNVLSSALVSREGDYTGTLSFAPEPGTTSPNLRKVQMGVKAHATDINGVTQVVLVGKDTYLPFEHVRLTGGGYDQDLLFGYPVALDTTNLTFHNDPRRPRITGKLHMSLPLAPVMPASNKLKRTFDFELTRDAGLSVGKCPCAAGYTCDNTSKLCFQSPSIPLPVSGHVVPPISERHASLFTWSMTSRTRLMDAMKAVNEMLFNKYGGFYGKERRNADGTADLVYDVAGFDFLNFKPDELGYKICKKWFKVTVNDEDFRKGGTCHSGKRASAEERSEDCPAGATWAITNGRGFCKKNNQEVAATSFCASLYDVNRQGFGHLWGPNPVGKCAQAKVADSDLLRRDYVPCVYGKIVPGGDFGDEETVNNGYDHVVDDNDNTNEVGDRDFSCRSMAKRAWGIASRPNGLQMADFMSACKTVNTEGIAKNGDRLSIYLCPFTNSTIGGFSLDARAEHVQCLQGTTTGTVNLDSTKQNGAVLAISGDKKCGSKAPADVNLYHLREMSPNASDSQSAIFWECIADLERDPLSTAMADWKDYFKARKCVSPERFLLALDVKTTHNDGADDKFVRSLQQWLGVAGFVATQGIEEMSMARVVTSSGPAGKPMTWARLTSVTQDSLALLLDDQVQKQLFKFPALSTLVGDAGAPDFDRTVPLPISIVNAVVTAYGLVEAHTNDVLEDVFTGCDEAGLPQTGKDALHEVSQLTRTLGALEILAVQLKHSSGSTAFEDPWKKAVDKLSAAREKALIAMEDLRSCKNPLGIPEDYVPLFFTEAQGANLRYFASSDFLLGKARELVDSAQAELNLVRQAWIDERNAAFHAQMLGTTKEVRLEEINRTAGAIIQDLCGSESGTAETILDRFESSSSDALTAENCYFSAFEAKCQGVDRPVDCYRGAIGEAAAGVISAGMDIELAVKNVADMQAKYESRGADCARIRDELAGNEELRTLHKSHMDHQRGLRGALERMKLIFSGQNALMSAVASNGATAFSGAQDLLATGMIQGVDLEMAQADSDYQATLSKRIDDQRVNACFDEVRMLKIGIDTAADVVKRRAHDGLAAAARFKSAQAKLRFTVRDAKDALAREEGREYVALSHNFWRPEKHRKFLLHFRAAKRLSYLAWLALKYDMQDDELAGGAEIIAARTPDQLDAVVGPATGGMFNFTRQVLGQPPSHEIAVLSLTEILGFAAADPDPATREEAERRLRAYLTSPEAALYNRVTGEYLGQGIRFNLSDIHSAQRCSERLWSVAASVHATDTTPDSRTAVILYKNRNFSSHDCQTQELRYESTRDEIGMMVPLLAEGVAKATQKANSKSKMGVDRTTLSEGVGGAEYAGASNELRLMGVYGEYTLLFPLESLVELDIGTIKDVYFRFDYLSAGDNQEAE